MTDEFNKENIPQQPEPSPESPTTPEPVVNNWREDGGYQYVPPRDIPQVYSQGYRPVVDGEPYVIRPEDVPPAKPPRKKRKKGCLIAFLSVLAAVAIFFAPFTCVGFLTGTGLMGVVGGALSLIGITLPEAQKGDDSSLPEDNQSTQPTTNENAPTLDIDEWDTNDGGLSTEEIVKRNYDSTVVLTMYSRANNFYFGESNLTEVGAASGIIMTEDGYVITNRHCVIDESTGRKYDRIDVTTYDGTIYENATVIGADEATDLAVIKLDATGLTPAQFGDSDALEVGARVVALGNAAGLSWTATQGIVSAKARDVYDDTGYAIKCLQVDVAINSGNSGGPLLNKQGLVVGINSAKIAATGYEGLGFSIPINEAKVVIDSLLKKGYVSGRVALGITGQTIDSTNYKGFMIATIEPGSCLEGTEARVNDLIVAVDDVTITDYGTLRAELAKHQVGDTIKLKLLRSDQRTGQVSSLTVTVTLKEQTAE